MDRRDFGPWGLELDPADFACALAALGVVGDRPNLTVEAIVGELDRSVETPQEISPRTERLHWSIWHVCHPGTRPVPPPQVSARELATAWRTFVSRRPPTLRVEMYEPLWAPDSEPDVVWLQQQLTRPEVRAASVYIRQDSPSAEAAWGWPVRVGVHSNEWDSFGASLQEFGRQLGSSNWPLPLFEVRELQDDDALCDLLVSTRPLRATLAALSQPPRGLRADCVLVLGGSGDVPASDVPLLLRTLRLLTRSAGATLHSLAEGARLPWFRRFIEGLSHDEPIDVALFRAGTAFGTNAPRTAAPPLLLATRQLVDVTRVSEQARRLVERIRKEPGRAINLSSLPASVLKLEPGLHPSDSLVVPLEQWLPGRLWQFESSDASALASFTRDTSAAEDTSASKAPRFLQAQMYSLEGPHPVQVTGTLKKATPHRVTVRIGLEDAQWSTAMVPFPDEKLEPSSEGHTLTVVFSEPQLALEPQVAYVRLPPRGSSTDCHFFVHTRAADALAARISVLYQNRLLQSGVLRARVGTESQPASHIELTLDALPRPVFEGLEQRRVFDAALVLNHDDQHRAWTTAITEGRASMFGLPENDIQGLTDCLSAALTEIADDPARFQGLDSEGSTGLLRTLAQHGATLHRVLIEDHPATDALRTAERIQVVSAKADAFLPLEFVYRYPAPEDGVPLCPHARDALASGHCTSTCPRNEKLEQVVCPLGFWGLSRTIERHAHRPEYTQLRQLGNLGLRAEPIGARNKLSPLKSALLAASYRAAAVEPTCVDDLVSALRGLTPHVRRVQTWEAWTDAVKTLEPSLLVLLPHHERKDGFDILEIGTEDMVEKLKSSLVKPKHVSLTEKKKEDGAQPGPVVLLMGCETSLARLSFESFVAQFRASGASVVVSTLATILGRSAAPMTAQLLQQMAVLAQGGNSSLGDVMLRLRRNLLLQGTPMVLGLTAYGDADWILTPPLT